MKIKKIEAYDLTIPHEVDCRPPWAPGRVENSRDFTLIIVRTDEGVSGYSGGNGHQAAKIKKLVEPYLLEKNPFLFEEALRVLSNAGDVWFVELALWDVLGKVASLPLYQLWGETCRKVKAYASTAELGSPEERAEQARHYMEQGFPGMKFRIHCDTLREDLEYVDAVVDEVGGRVDIMIDANQATLHVPSPEMGPVWDYHRAYVTARELEERGVLWLEEPLGRWNFEELGRLTNNVDIYIAGGEKNVGVHEFRWMLEKGCYDIIQPDVIIAGSVSQVLKVRTLCEAYHVHFIPHHGVSAFGLAANIHLLCSYSGWSYIEYMYDPPYRSIDTYQCLRGIVTNPIRIDSEGYVAPYSAPGLGVEVDESLIKDFT